MIHSGDSTFHIQLHNIKVQRESNWQNKPAHTDRTVRAGLHAEHLITCNLQTQSGSGVTAEQPHASKPNLPDSRSPVLSDAQTNIQDYSVKISNPRALPWRTSYREWKLTSCICALHWTTAFTSIWSDVWGQTLSWQLSTTKNEQIEFTYWRSLVRLTLCFAACSQWSLFPPTDSCAASDAFIYSLKIVSKLAVLFPSSGISFL